MGCAHCKSPPTRDRKAQRPSSPWGHGRASHGSRFAPSPTPRPHFCGAVWRRGAPGSASTHGSIHRRGAAPPALDVGVVADDDRLPHITAAPGPSQARPAWLVCPSRRGEGQGGHAEGNGDRHKKKPRCKCKNEKVKMRMPQKKAR